MAYDIISGENFEIVGADEYDVIGAEDDDIAQLLAAAAGEVPSNMRDEILERALGRGATVVRRTSAMKARCYPLGFDSGAAVAAGANVNVTSQPQVAFRVERLVVPSDIGGSFTINDVLVGKNSQFAANVPVPARVFDENAVGVRLRGDTAQTTINVTLNVTNISGAAIRFRAAVIGTAIE